MARFITLHGDAASIGVLSKSEVPSLYATRAYASHTYGERGRQAQLNFDRKITTKTN